MGTLHMDNIHVLVLKDRSGSNQDTYSALSNRFHVYFLVELRTTIVLNQFMNVLTAFTADELIDIESR